ncbi:hypothetical protein EJP77_12415 [Paenibacillus zeisoli]|uniref:Uncharacterized protein n=1 Tax=Paenibacillus zeisoli TaxID=2496267 RepID=A0A3S1B6Y6_9BACL|nr:hypothetical protein [Paenibacillus zeisoli]RUT30620.1 hypothetical protein EJP77_12415 [Paenibacillus zeisoli]
MTFTIMLMVLLLTGAVVVPLLVIEVNRRREITSEFDRSFFNYTWVSLGIQALFLVLFLTDTLQLLEIWGHVIWLLAVLAGLYICVYGIWKRTKNRKNVILFLLTGGISVILGFLYVLGLFITSM